MAQGLRGFYLADADQLSALPGVELSMQPIDPGHVTLSRIKGGNDRLVEKLAARKGLKVSLQLEVKRVEHDARGVSVRVADRAGRLSAIKGDYLVMAAPAPIVRDLEFTPALPVMLRQALEGADARARHESARVVRSIVVAAEGPSAGVGLEPRYRSGVGSRRARSRAS